MHHNQAHLYSQSGLWRITCLTFACYVLAAPSFAPPLKAMLEVATTQVWMTVFSCFMKGYQQTLEQLLSLEKLNECDELPAFELEAPLQGKWRIFLAKPRLALGSNLGCICIDCYSYVWPQVQGITKCQRPRCWMIGTNIRTPSNSCWW